MRKPPFLSGFIITALFMASLLAACGSRAATATATLSVEQVQTEAVATFAAGLTSTAAGLPTNTPTETETVAPMATSTVAASATQPPPPTGGSAPAACLGLAFVSDVTIPDNSKMTPGEKFTKTWRVRNNGTCAWESGFTFRFLGGEAMGGSPVVLSQAVQPGSETNMSVALTAPGSAGSYRGNWRMTNKTGAFFGDEVYVLITVGTSTATASTTASATATPTSSQTPTPTETATGTTPP
jgi:hypothetical protein